MFQLYGLVMLDETDVPAAFPSIQAMGTLLGTMFGFVSAALLTPIHGGEREDGLPAAPGVVSYAFPLLPPTCSPQTCYSIDLCDISQSLRAPADG